MNSVRRMTEATEVLDISPIELDGFTLTARSAVVVGRPKLAGWVRAMTFASAAHEAAPYWVADLMAHAEDRADWREKLDQAIAATGVSMKRIQNLAALRKVEAPERALAPSPAHAETVAPLPRAEQTKWLTKAKEEGWTRSELRKNISAAKRTKVIDGQAVLSGMFGVVYADPAWSDTTVEELMRLPVKAHALPDSTLFLWVPESRLLANPGPRDVIEAWGFRYSTSIIWDRVLGRTGRFSQVRHDVLVIAERGDGRAEVPTPQPDSLQVFRWAPDQTGHPKEFRLLIEKMFPAAKKLALFAGEKVGGWTCLGNDPKAWGA